MTAANHQADTPVTHPVSHPVTALTTARFRRNGGQTSTARETTVRGFPPDISVPAPRTARRTA